MECARSLRDGSWLTRQRLIGYSLLLIAAYALTLVVWIGMAEGWKDRAGNPIGSDFVNVYAAGRMAQEGRPEAVYDWAAHKEVESAVIGFDAPSYYGWHYPPLFLGLALLIACLPYGAALALYIFGGLTAYLAALRHIVPAGRESLLALLAFPGVFVNLSNGQNGFITTALLGGGLALLEKQPWLGGILLGGLVYKPQFFVVIPCLLFCGRYWRAFFASVGTALALTGLSLAVFGLKTGKAFIVSTQLTQSLILEQGAAGWGKIQSLFSFARALGFDVKTAYGLQAVLTVGAFLVTASLWRPPATHATRLAALCGAVLAATPYLFDYDLMALAVPVAFLATQGWRDGFMPYEKTCLAMLWVWPFIARGIGLHGLPLTPFLLIGLLALCVIRTRRLPSEPAP